MKILILFIFVSLISKNLSAYQEISIQKDNSLMNYEDILNSISSSVAQEDIQEYIEDCSVCCRPIIIDVNLNRDFNQILCNSNE